jgi:hypothetical protein
MKRHPAIVLTAAAAASLLMGPVCDPSSGGVANNSTGPLDPTKAIVSCATNPSLLPFSPAPVAVTVRALLLFNSSLIVSSVKVLDVTDGTPALLGSLVPAGITAVGQLFEGVVSVDTSVPVGTLLRLRCSAAYQGDPRRATALASVPVVEPPIAPAFAPENTLATSSGELVVSQVVALLGPDAGEGAAQQLADEIGAEIAGFDPVTRTTIYELPLSAADPGALVALDGAVAALLARPELVHAAFPNVSVALEASADDAPAASPDAPFAAARIPQAWEALSNVLAALGRSSPAPVKIGVIDQGLEVGSSGLLGSGAGGGTGSDTPFELLYSDQGLSYGQLPGAFSALEMRGAQVIVLPLGWTRAGVSCADAGAPQPLDADTFASVTEALRGAIAAHPNVLFVASAGNCGADAASHAPGGMSSAPPNLLTVAATDSAGNAAGFSNTGAGVDLAAPGIAVPEPTATGTSASAGMVAQAAGLYLSVRGNLDAQGVEALARALKLSRVGAGTGLPGVPRLDALSVLAAGVTAR